VLGFASMISLVDDGCGSPGVPKLSVVGKLFALNLCSCIDKNLSRTEAFYVQRDVASVV
jgi:hypothetical protein